MYFYFYYYIKQIRKGFIMKVYLKGLITGASLVFAFMVFTGQKHGHHGNHDNDGHHNIDDVMHKLEDLEAKLEAFEQGVYCYNID